MGSGLELIEVVCFKVDCGPVTFLLIGLRAQVMLCYFSRGEGKSTRKSKIIAQINSWRVVGSFDIFLVQSSIGKSADILCT